MEWWLKELVVVELGMALETEKKNSKRKLDCVSRSIVKALFEYWENTENVNVLLYAQLILY